MKIMNLLILIVFSWTAMAEESAVAVNDDGNWRFEIGLGSAHRDANNVAMGFGYRLGTTHKGYNTHFINYDFGVRTVEGITVTPSSALDITFHQLSLSTEGGCLNNFCSDTSVGLIYADVDETFFSQSSDLGYFIRVGGAFKKANNPNANWIKSSALLIHLNAWFGFDKTKANSTNVYNGFFPTMGSRITF